MKRRKRTRTLRVSRETNRFDRAYRAHDDFRGHKHEGLSLASLFIYSRERFAVLSLGTEAARVPYYGTFLLA